MKTELNLWKGKIRENYTLRSTPERIKYQGIVDFESLYRTMVHWFRSRKYDFYESLYKDKPPELELEWTAKRKLDDFYQYKINIEFHLFDIREVEVIKEGVKKKMIDCRMMIQFDPIVVWDWQDRWKGNKFVEMAFKFYTQYVIMRELELKYADPLWYHTYQLHEKVKECLGMETAGNTY
jgi:hypothetical protein